MPRGERSLLQKPSVSCYISVSDLVHVMWRSPDYHEDTTPDCVVALSGQVAWPCHVMYSLHLFHFSPVLKKGQRQFVPKGCS